MGKWSEVPYIQAFMVPYENHTLYGSCNSNPGEPEDSSNILDDPLLSSPISQWGNPGPPSPDCITTSPEPPTSPALCDRSQTPPPYVPLYPTLPQEREASPSGVTLSGASYYPGSGKLGPLREVANGKGTIRVHVPFSLTNLPQCRQKLGRFSEDPSKFVEMFHALTLIYDLTWKDVQVVLSTCCNPEEKQRIWTAAQGHADQLTRDQPKHFATGGDAVPNQEPPWNYNPQAGTEARKHMIQCV